MTSILANLTGNPSFDTESEDFSRFSTLEFIRLKNQTIAVVCAITAKMTANTDATQAASCILYLPIQCQVGTPSTQALRASFQLVTKVSG